MKRVLIIILICLTVCCGAIGFAACKKTVSVSGIKFNENYIELYVSDEYYLEYAISPQNAENQNVSFYCSNESILSVQGDGKVLALAEGTAEVTVITEDGGYSDKCNIIIKPKTEEDSGENESGGNIEPTIETYVVTFIADGKIVGTCEFTEENFSIDIPEPLPKFGYTVEWEEFTLSLENIIVNAIYTPIEYFADFVNDDGEVIRSVVYTVESVSIDEPEVPPRQYYVGKWEEYSFTAGGITISAVYSPEEYNAVFMANGKVVSTLVYTVENWSVTAPSVPNIEGYTGKWESFYLVYGGITVNAIYTPIQYAVTFNANGNTVAIIPFTIESGIVEEPAVPSIAGYNGVWQTYAIVCRNFTVNAVYTPINYTITYLNTKGASNSNPKSYNVENVFALKDISLFGYVFDGWYMDGKKINSVAVLYQDLTLTAQWTLIEYKIIFTDENYNEIIATVTYTVEDTQIDIPEVPYKEGYYAEWSYFELNYKTAYVHAVYTKVDD